MTSKTATTFHDCQVWSDHERTTLCMSPKRWVYCTISSLNLSCSPRISFCQSKVLLRIYGRTHGEQALESVLTDTVVFTLLSERRLGPRLHGIFPGGRIEQYIPVSEIDLVTAKPPDTNHCTNWQCQFQRVNWNVGTEFVVLGFFVAKMDKANRFQLISIERPWMVVTLFVFSILVWSECTVGVEMC